MNHFNESHYYSAHSSHHLSQGPASASTLLLGPAQQRLIHKLAAVIANGSAPSSSSSPSEPSPSNSILYNAISTAAAATSTFAIPQPPPPLISICGPTSTTSNSTYYQSRSNSNSSHQSSSPLARHLALPSSGSSLQNGTLGVATGRRQQALASEMRNCSTASVPPTVVILDSDGVSTTTISSSTTVSAGGGRGRGRGRPPLHGVNGVGRARRPYTHRSSGHTPFCSLSLSHNHSAPQVASVAGAHQNENHNSLAASMPLLSSYLRNGTINGYQNGHNMGHRASTSSGLSNGVANHQPKSNSTNGLVAHVNTTASSDTHKPFGQSINLHSQLSNGHSATETNPTNSDDELNEYDQCKPLTIVLMHSLSRALVSYTRISDLSHVSPLIAHFSFPSCQVR